MKRLAFLKKKWVIALIIIFLIVGGIAAYNAFVPKTYPEDKTYKVQRTDLEDFLALSGEVSAGEKASLQFQTGGFLTWVGVKEGDSVTANQGIASLDQRQLQAQFKKYLNNYEITRREFDQTKDDTEDMNEASSEIHDQLKRLAEQSQFSLNNSVIDVELQQLALQYSYLSTPIAGVVTRVDAPNAGVNIPMGAVFEVVNPSTLYFSATVDQTEVTKIQEGMTGEITLDAFPESPVNGTISQISFTPKQGETGTVYEAKVAILGGNTGILRLGMTGDVSFILGKKEDALVIPLRFIKPEGEKYFVNKKEGNGTKKVEVEIGDEYEGNIEVLKGLSENDIIYELE